MKNEKCFDIGTIQAFIDGELASGLSEKLIKHIALCDSCAALLAETEEENNFAFSVLDDELNYLVPTERLRTKVFDSIREIKHKEKSNWWHNLTERFGFSNGFNLNSPSLLAFASVVLFVSALAVGFNFYKSVPESNEVAIHTPSVQPFNVNEITVSSSDVSDESEISNDIPVDENPVLKAVDSNNSENRDFKALPKIKPQKAVYTPKVEENNFQNEDINSTPRTVNPTLAEEGGYLQTIATLKKTVDENKDITLRPTERIAFERDLAVVNDAIKKMKEEVNKNPNNQAAREVLRSSYQNKIDLLNSVAERNELIASIQ